MKPGHYPFTRGCHPQGYQTRTWTMRQFSGFGSAYETNERFKYLLAHGGTGLSIAFDMPTIMGYDADHALAKGEVGRCGVAISSLQDMEILFNGIDMGSVSTSMTINAPASVLLAFYIATAEKQGVARSRLMGTIQNDILKEYIAQKTFIFPPEASLRLIVDTMEFCTQNVPLWNTISISGFHIREAGATAVQELAFTLANGLEYVKRGIERDLNLDDFAPRLSFFFDANHYTFMEEIAKYRAARRIWAKKLKEVYNAKKERSMWMRFHTQTAGVTLTADNVENNIIRVTLQALAAVFGTTQSLHTNSMDEALALPTEKAVTIALNTQRIIAEETDITQHPDPFGGSEVIEKLTDELEQKCEEYFEKIEALGGVVPAMEAGFFHREITTSAFQEQKSIDAGRQSVVGRENVSASCPILKIDPRIEAHQVKRLKALRKKRDNAKVKKDLETLRAISRQGKNVQARGFNPGATKESKHHTENAGETLSQHNVMPVLIQCAHDYVTIGEICQVWREEFGEYRDHNIF